MFKCAICGKEYDDKDVNEIRLLNKQTNDMEIFHVCPTCFDNKEDMIAYSVGKKNLSNISARRLYDYFSDLTDDIDSELLRKYIDVRLRGLRSKLAEKISSQEFDNVITDTGKKKATPLGKLKVSLVLCDAILALSVFILFCIIAGISSTVAAASIIFGILIGISLFVGIYFVIDNYIKFREDYEKRLKKTEEILGGNKDSLVENKEKLSIEEKIFDSEPDNNNNV